MYTEKVWEQFGLFLHKVMSIVCQSHKSTALSGSASENAESTKTSSGPALSGERSFNYFEWTDMIPNHSESRSGEKNNYIKRLSVKCKVFNQIILAGINQNLPEIFQMPHRMLFYHACYKKKYTSMSFLILGMFQHLVHINIPWY